MVLEQKVANFKEIYFLHDLREIISNQSFNHDLHELLIDLGYYTTPLFGSDTNVLHYTREDKKTKTGLDSLIQFDLFQYEPGFTYLRCYDKEELETYTRAFFESRFKHSLSYCLAGAVMGEVTALSAFAGGASYITDFPLYFSLGTLAGFMLSLFRSPKSKQGKFYNRLITGPAALEQALITNDLKL